MRVSVEEIQEIVNSGIKNIKFLKFCVLPNEIATSIKAVAFGNEDFGYVLIGAEKIGNTINFCAINISINMNTVIQSAIKQAKVNTDIFYQIHKIQSGQLCVIKVKTCMNVKVITQENVQRMNCIIKDLLVACVKLQANAIYYTSTEDQRNDYIRDLLETAGHDIKDQTRRGLSPSRKAAGEVDILIKENELPITIIEALNLDSLNTTYLDKHIDKIYDYDTAGTSFNILLGYVTVTDFNSFWEKYLQHIEAYTYPYPLIFVDNNFIVENFSYSEIRITRTLHNRNNCETILYHICVLIGK